MVVVWLRRFLNMYNCRGFYKPDWLRARLNFDAEISAAARMLLQAWKNDAQPFNDPTKYLRLQNMPARHVDVPLQEVRDQHIIKFPSFHFRFMSSNLQFLILKIIYKKKNLPKVLT